MDKLTISLLAAVIIILFTTVFFLLPDCSYRGGFMMIPGRETLAKSCSCVGIEIFYRDNAAVDGISASKCVGIMK